MRSVRRVVIAALIGPAPAAAPAALGDVGFTGVGDVNTDGVAHYGLFADFLAAVSPGPNGARDAAAVRLGRGVLASVAANGVASAVRSGNANGRSSTCS